MAHCAQGAESALLHAQPQGRFTCNQGKLYCASQARCSPTLLSNAGSEGWVQLSCSYTLGSNSLECYISEVQGQPQATTSTWSEVAAQTKDGHMAFGG